MRSLFIAICLLLTSFISYTAHAESFGYSCAQMHAKLGLSKSCDMDFEVFTDRVIAEAPALSPREWETVRWLAEHYVQHTLRFGDMVQGSQQLKRLIEVVSMPTWIKGEIRQFWQILNSENVPLGALVRQVGRPDQLMSQLYTMTLYSIYEENKQKILLAKERELLDEALIACESLQEKVQRGDCAPHPDLIEIEMQFLKKTALALRMEKGENVLSQYCDAEEHYAFLVNTLVTDIVEGGVQRSHEIDVVLLSHALCTLPWDRQKGIFELEILLDHGRYLHTSLSCYAFFTLLDLYRYDHAFDHMKRLLMLGEAVFCGDHEYAPKYHFFSGVYFYEMGRYAEAQTAFDRALEAPSRLGLTLAELYEYLGCLAFLCHNLDEAFKYFYAAEKGWHRDEAKLGLLLVSSEPPIQWAKHVEQYCQDKRFSEVFKVCEGITSLTVSDIHHHIVQDMLVKVPSQVPPVERLVREHLRVLENMALEEAISKSSGEVQQSLSIWLALRQDRPWHADEAVELSYRALNGDSMAIDALSELFSQECSPLQSTLRLVWALTKEDRSIPPLYFDQLPLRLYGDRLFLMAYSISDYLSGKEPAVSHLMTFIELFPCSEYIPLIYYLLSYAEAGTHRVGWLVNALDQFSEISLRAPDGEYWASLYYAVKLDLAQAYLDLGNLSTAIALFEEVKEDWQVENHPRRKWIRQEQLWFEVRWVEGLAKAYALLEDKRLLHTHLEEHITKRLLCPKYRTQYMGVLSMTRELCQLL